MLGNKHWAETHHVGYFNLAMGQEAPWWVGWTGLDGCTSRLKLLLVGFEYQQTKWKIPWKNCQLCCHAML